MRGMSILSVLAMIFYACPTSAQDGETDAERQPTPIPAPVPQRSNSRIPIIGDEPWSVIGDIDSLDGTTRAGLLYEDHRVEFMAGQRLRISASSNQIDPLVQVLRPGSDEVLAEDDDSGFRLNARLIFTPNESGIHIIRVVNSFPGLRGLYALNAESAQPFPAVMPIEGIGGRPTEWTHIDGDLGAGDARLEGRIFKDYVLRLSQGDELLLRLESTDFDPIVQVIRADDREGGFLAGDDDSGIGTNSLLLFRAENTGDYVIRVTTFSQGETGRFTLRVGR